MVVLNKQRLRSDKVTYEEANLFEWRPRERYDVVFFAFWLSHVPPDRFAEFWALVRDALKPDGRFFFVDSCREETSTAIDHGLPEPESPYSTRKLNDGRAFTVVKVFYEPAELSSALQALGWRSCVRETPSYFIYGHGSPSPRPNALGRS